MRVNECKRRLLEGQSVIGIGSSLNSALVAETLSLAGFDFVLVDNQHGAWDDESNVAAFRSIALGAATPMIRVPCNDYYAIGRALDRGALGIIVPMVNSPDEAAEAVRAVRYPPLGGRSIGPFATSFLGADYIKRANVEVYLAVQIETATAAARAYEILSVEGVDGMWLGPNDLAATMGVAFGSEAHLETIMKVYEACVKAGKVPGIAGTPQSARSWLDRGFRFVTVGGEIGLLAATCQELVHSLK